jgi:hypothetical protein
MSRLLRDHAHMVMPMRMVRIVKGREIREVEMGSDRDLRWMVEFAWPTREDWDRIMRERAAVNP